MTAVSRQTSSSDVYMDVPSPLGAAIQRCYSGVMGQSDLASRLGVTQQTVSAWVHGKSRPPVDAVFAIERECGRPAGWIFYAAGLIPQRVSPLDALRLDVNLSEPYRRLIVEQYRTALRLSAEHRGE